LLFDLPLVIVQDFLLRKSLYSLAIKGDGSCYVSTLCVQDIIHEVVRSELLQFVLRTYAEIENSATSGIEINLSVHETDRILDNEPRNFQTLEQAVTTNN
jgi:hypothetical protein